MPTIHAKLIEAPRKQRRCHMCGCLPRTRQPIVRAYGYADVGDKPYAIYLCVECGLRCEGEKVRHAAGSSSD